MLPLALMKDFNFLDVCWKYNRVLKVPGVCGGYQFLTELVREPTREGDLPDLLLVNRDEFVGEIKVGDHLSLSNLEITEFSILGESRRGQTLTSLTKSLGMPTRRM